VATLVSGLLARPESLVALVAYAVALLAIGAWSARRTRSASAYFVAGRGAGVMPIALATMASAFSGFVFIGGPGLASQMGFASLFIVLPVGFTPALLVATSGERLRELSTRHEILSLPDALEAAFGTRRARALGALAILVGSVAYLAAQLLALGILLRAILGPAGGEGSLVVPVLVGAVVVAAYCVAGGMIAGLASDVLQGGLMLVAAVWTFAIAFAAVDGPGGAAATLSATPELAAKMVEPFGGASAQTALALFVLFGVGVLGQPHMLHKFLMLRDPASLRLFPALVGASQSLVLLVWVGIGLAVPTLVAKGAMPPLATPDDATPAFLAALAPPLLIGLVVAGAVAAIMSTADAFLSVGSAALVRDLPRAFGRRVRDELAWGRIATLGLCALATLLALGSSELVAIVGRFAFGVFAAALAPVMSLGLAWKRVGARAAETSMAAGLALSVGLESWSRWGDAWGLPSPPFAREIGASAVALLASYLLLILAAYAFPPTSGSTAKA
jgi:Na+/proline symporter